MCIFYKAIDNIGKCKFLFKDKTGKWFKFLLLKFVIMRFCILLIFVVLSWVSIKAQPTCDIATNGVSATPNSAPVGQTMDFIFDVYNDAGGGSCSYTANSVQVYLFFPSNGIAYQSIIVPAGGVGSYFNWTYDSPNRTLIGLNYAAIPDEAGELVTVRALVTPISGYPALRTIGVTILQYEDGPPFPSNNPDNDNGTVTVQITAPLPIELSSFTGKNTECNTIVLNWETASEKNNDYMEVLRSREGTEFVSVGKVQGANKPSGASYSFVDDKGLKEGVKYFYRLKQVDFDGRIEFFDIISVHNECEGLIKSFSIHPNPAIEKVFVSLVGFNENDEVTLMVTNAIGEKVMTVNNALINDPNEIKLNNLPAGIYNIKIAGFDEVTSKRFIKID